MDERLKLIGSMVKPCNSIADIGTDHGLLICELVERGIGSKGIASDINPMPLAKAEQEIAARQLGDRVECRCTDGLSGIALQDSVVIAGMGGELIAQIIDCWEHARSGKTRFYLQPMTKPERLRRWLWEQGYSIVDERCCVAAGRPYVVLEAVYIGSLVDYTNSELYLGSIDPRRGEQERQYLVTMRGRLAHVAAGLAEGGTDTVELDYWQAIINEADRRLAT